VTGVALGGRLPADDNNGLAAIAADLLAEPSLVRTAVVLFDTAKVTTSFDKHSRTVTARIRHIEPLTDIGDELAGIELLRAALRRRNIHELPGGLGVEQPALPFDDEPA
jgi:hypothetical protein